MLFLKAVFEIIVGVSAQNPVHKLSFESTIIAMSQLWVTRYKYFTMYGESQT